MGEAPRRAPHRPGSLEQDGKEGGRLLQGAEIQAQASGKQRSLSPRLLGVMGQISASVSSAASNAVVAATSHPVLTPRGSVWAQESPTRWVHAVPKWKLFLTRL